MKRKQKQDTVIVTARVDRKAHAKLKKLNINVSSIIQDAILMAADKVEK